MPENDKTDTANVAAQLEQGGPGSVATDGSAGGPNALTDNLGVKSNGTVDPSTDAQGDGAAASADAANASNAGDTTAQSTKPSDDRLIEVKPEFEALSKADIQKVVDRDIERIEAALEQLQGHVLAAEKAGDPEAHAAVSRVHQAYADFRNTLKSV